MTYLWHTQWHTQWHRYVNDTGEYVIDTLYDHVNDIQKNVFLKRGMSLISRGMSMTYQWHVKDMSLSMSLIGYVIGDAPDWRKY
jgi:hypothetical protein